MGMSSGKDIVEGQIADHPAIVQTLARAFQDDPAVSWILPDAEQRAKRLPKMFSIILPNDSANGIALRSTGDEVATLWLPLAKRIPGVWS